VAAEPIVGIDLGTTHSLVATVRDGVPMILKTREGERLLPSVISFANASEPVIGYSAKNRKVVDSKHTVYSVKRLLGRSFEDLRPEAGHLPFEIEGDSLVRVKVGDRSFSAIEISAMILKELKAGAEASLGMPVKKAVITVPAYFNDSQRQATRAAGRIAGLEVLRIINEPTAASLAYGLDKKRQGLIAVFDLGGGTFDISILKLHDGIFEVLATNGDTSLGGDDLDLVLVKKAAEEISQRFGVDVFSESEIALRAALIDAAEKVKIELSTALEATLRLDMKGKTYERVFTISEFDELCQPILEKTRQPCLSALKDAGLQLSDLSDVVMVGGPTRLKSVREMARQIFGREPNSSVHPDEVVALGAAIQADILAGNNRDLLLLDVVPLSLGLETYGGLMSTLIPRNTRIPTAAREVFTTFVDRQTAVDVHVLQGERDRVEDNRSLARFKLQGIERLPAGLPRIEVFFLIDADGILQVAAKDLRNGHEQSIEVKPTYGLTDDEVTRMLEASATHAETDVQYRQFVDAKNEAEAILLASEKKLPDAIRLLSNAEATTIREKIDLLKSELGKPVSPQQIQNRIPNIQKASRDLSQATVRLADLLVKDAMVRATQSKK
jgi:Fe-S protein assembly chaperone HscA